MSIDPVVNFKVTDELLPALLKGRLKSLLVCCTVVYVNPMPDALPRLYKVLPYVVIYKVVINDFADRISAPTKATKLVTPLRIPRPVRKGQVQELWPTGRRKKRFS